MNLNEANTDQLTARQAELQSKFEKLQAAGLTLDLTRGKPGSDQLDLSNEMDGILNGFFLLQDGTDVRNYGGILGIPEARQLGGDMLGIPPKQVLVGGNSSLTMMYNYIASMMPVWEQNDSVKFLCPVPGYDRHFTLCEHFNIEMINVGFDADGPDMSTIETLVKEDPQIKGIWCVPKYSNPTGHTYSKSTVEKFAQLATNASPDFRIMWDNAYTVHDLTDTPTQLEDLMSLARAANTEDSVVMFASTSKVTFAGAGISFVGTSERNLSSFESFLSDQVIGFDKVNQLRHVRFLEDAEGVKKHMAKHRAIIEPKFNLVAAKLAELEGKGVAQWTTPSGGYFISLDTLPGVASQVVSLAAEAGVKLTPAGATFPYGKDPEDRNIRIAPTFPSTEDLSQALDVFVVCLELASVNHLLETQTG